MIQMRFIFLDLLCTTELMQNMLPVLFPFLRCRIPVTGVLRGKQKMKCVRPHQCWTWGRRSVALSRRQIHALLAVVLQTSPDAFIDSVTISNPARHSVNTCHSMGATNCCCQSSLSNYKWAPAHESISLTEYTQDCNLLRDNLTKTLLIVSDLFL